MGHGFGRPFLSLIGLVFLLSAAPVAGSAEPTSTLEEVRARGHLVCGVSHGRPGFSRPDASGRWQGLSADVCRAVAAAIFGDAEKVVFMPLTTIDNYTTLQGGDVDILFYGMAWTLTRDFDHDLEFVQPIFYDSTGFLAPKSLALTSARELDGGTVCVFVESLNELDVLDFADRHGLSLDVVSFEYAPELVAAYESGTCDTVGGDLSALVALLTRVEIAEAHEILPDVISKVPISPVVRQGDDHWRNIVEWTVFALLQAEESGVTSGNIDDMRQAADPVVRRLLGASGDAGARMGLPGDWAYQVVSQVGNYAEIFDRNLGPETQLAQDRGLNALWRDGGLMYPIPFR